MVFSSFKKGVKITIKFTPFGYSVYAKVLYF